MYFVNCKHIPQQGRSFCSLIFFDYSDKVLNCLKSCLWKPGTYRHKILRLSIAQFNLVLQLAMLRLRCIAIDAKLPLISVEFSRKLPCQI